MAEGNFFVRRPTVSIVLSIVLVIFGLVALKALPISQYPNVIPPEIQVFSTYNGADAVSVEQSVTAPLEQKINGVENMIYVRSINANDGTSSVRVSFEVGSDLDMSNVLVQNRVSEAQPALPEEVKRLGVSVKKSLSFPMLLVTLRSPNSSYDSSFLSNYATINITDALSRVHGVGSVTLFGGSDYAMRLWVRPDRLAGLNLTINDIVRAVQAQNLIAPGGQIGAPPAPPGTDLTLTVRLQGRLTTPEEFAEVIVKANPDGSSVRLRDVGRVELGSQLYNSIGRYNGKPAAVMAIFQSPGSNALEVAERIRATMEELATRFPDDIEYTISLDTTKSITAGVDEILHTLLEAVVLVILVVFIFLQNWRATFIPLLTIPVSLIATFSIFPALGFSVNTLSLLGLVLAIGIVVDDAIVVVEAVMHHIEHGKSPREAVLAAMREVTGPVIATALILAAVFVPVVFMEGISGQFFLQFAVTIAISVVFSAICALTLSPALSALLLKAPGKGGGLFGRLFALFNRGFDALTARYLTVARFFATSFVSTVLLLAVVAGVIAFSVSALPSGFVPEEDQGYVLAALQLPDAASIQRSDVLAKRAEEIIMATAGVDSVTTVTGYSLITSAYSSNTAFFFIWLKPWGERTAPELEAPALIRSLTGALTAGIPEALGFAFGPPAIPGLGSGSGFSLMLQDRGGNTPEYLAEQANAFIEAVRQRPEIGRITTSFRAAVPQLYAAIDREKVFKQGVALTDVNQSLAAMLGGAYVNDFNRFGRLYKVYVQAEPEYRDQPEDLGLFHVRNQSGAMVPLNTLLSMSDTKGPEFTNRFNLYRAVEITGVPAPGYSSGEALRALEEVAAAALPADVGHSWNAMSYQEATASSGMAVFVLGGIFVFLILAAQYESWKLPFSVLLGTPIALGGAYGGLWIAREILGESYLNNIFAQIGVLTLIGLAAKNAILIVEFARMKVDEGLPLLEAALEAAKLRFRPILMTAFAFILGVVPLLTAMGAGAEGRKVIGMAVFSGMLGATLIGVLVIPALFVFVEGFGRGRGKSAVPHPAPQEASL